MHCRYHNFTVGCSVAPISACEWLSAVLVLLNRRYLKCNSASHVLSVLLEIFAGITGQNILLLGQLKTISISMSPMFRCWNAFSPDFQLYVCVLILCSNRLAHCLFWDVTLSDRTFKILELDTNLCRLLSSPFLSMFAVQRSKGIEQRLSLGADNGPSPSCSLSPTLPLSKLVVVCNH